MADPILLARHGEIECLLLPALANRHGLITGATGTGKTISLQKLAESLSQMGVPVFMADVKGDLTGISQPGRASAKLLAVLQERGIDAPAPCACPTTLWDVFGEQGHPVRTTVSDMGPLLLSRMLGLNETQAGVLQMVFKIADDHGLALLDLKDLRAMLQHVGEHASEFTTQYGNVSAASVGAIQRGLLQIETQGGDKFFGEPMLNIADFMQTVDGQGVINILAADKLMAAPRLYATFLLWMLSELFETLPEVGDLDQPKLVFFFDEAHLLFKDAPPALVERIELVVRLVRSKGVGVYFVTQNPLDIPDAVLGQLGNRVQHALRAFTPRDQKAVKAAAETMRPKPGLDIAMAITELGVGEALVSLLDDKGRPCITERVFVLPPGSQIGPITPAQRKTLMEQSLVAGVYEQQVDRESAYEKLTGRAAASAQSAERDAQAGAPSGPRDAATGRPTGSRTMADEAGDVFQRGAADSGAGDLGGAQGGAQGGARGGTRAGESEGEGGMLDGLKDVLFGSTGPRGGRREGLAEAAAKSALRSIGSSVGRELVRGVLGSLLGGKSGRSRR
ncbi:helicase HerA-like domain-containing protein [Roseateles terrae]|uniref:Helicase HerA-like C-terminal domain-containing protein n=1 Tax=Roseateles terrae TaxID=431060 RepID=A0ABR6GPM8_9BURK|nr:helicase HerA-like domain-containing protein [Roseateles terrae]MBB3194076.1 hypothetical protein [Roseateles terrae]OWQ87940.1 ATP-binding protein [Roseateles terrae]